MTSGRKNKPRAFGGAGLLSFLLQVFGQEIEYHFQDVF